MLQAPYQVIKTHSSKICQLFVNLGIIFFNSSFKVALNLQKVAKASRTMSHNEIKGKHHFCDIYIAVCDRASYGYTGVVKELAEIEEFLQRIKDQSIKT